MEARIRILVKGRIRLCIKVTSSSKVIRDRNTAIRNHPSEYGSDLFKAILQLKSIKVVVDEIKNAKGKIVGPVLVSDPEWGEGRAEDLKGRIRIRDKSFRTRNIDMKDGDGEGKGAIQLIISAE